MVVNWNEIITRSLEEDRVNDDVTTQSIVPKSAIGIANVVAKSSGIICGCPAVLKTFEIVDRSIALHWNVQEGSKVQKNESILSLEGNLRSILLAERTFLNLLTHLSGIATLTRKFVDLVSPFNIVIRDTRKTHSGLRDVEKYAVRVGGGQNHRVNLQEFGLIKENHIIAAGGLINVLEKFHQLEIEKPNLRFELEVEDLEQLQLALNFGVKEILLDNFTPEMVSKAVEITNQRAILEVSGGINLQNVQEYAQTGVNRISIGALTHSAIPLDLSLRIISVDNG